MEIRMKKVLLGVGIILLSVGCTEKAQPINLKEQAFEEYQPNKNEIAYEEYISEIDANDSLSTGNSLYYSKGNGASVEVKIYLNAKNETVKLVERFTGSVTQSVGTKTFYLKKGKKFASKERFEEGEAKDVHFIERVSYYDENEKPVITKLKKATYEEELDAESFAVSEKYNCKMDRALDVLNQRGEFATTFQGFIKDDPYLYLIVGEDEKEGYASALVVQFVDRTIQKLQAEELQMIGKPLIVDFETLNGEQGFEYQILLSVALR